MAGSTRILGIDPGLRLTGYAVLDYDVRKPAIVDAGVIRLDDKRSIAERLVELERELESIVTEYVPGRIAVEQLYAHYAHPRTAILMGHARGVILLVAAKHDIVPVELSANRVKQSLTGHGHADKSQMQRSVQLLFGLSELPKPPDVADALAIALCCGRDDGIATAGSIRRGRAGKRVTRS